MIAGQIGVIAGSQTPLLSNLYSGLTVGFSLRRLSKTYGGKCIRVRRSSDSTLMDIGFSGNNLDITTLMTFVGAGDGFVSTWYDQSGNGYNFTQATTSRQPAIISGGTLITDNGKPALQVIGADTQTFIIATSNFAGLNFDIYATLSIFSASSKATNFLLNQSGAGNIFWAFVDAEPALAIPSKGYVQASGTTGDFEIIPNDDGIQKLINFYKEFNDVSCATFNDSRVFSATTVLAAPIASGSKTYSAFLIDGKAQEILMFSGGNQAINKTAIKSNVTSYYSLGSDIAPLLPFLEIFGQNGEITPGVQYNVPKQWIPSDGGIDVSAYDLSASISYPNCDVPGSSGGVSLVFVNGMGSPVDIIARPISTIGKTNITVSWNESIQTGGAQLLELLWSVDNVVWNSLVISEPTPDNAWHAVTPIVLPAGANNKHTLYFKFIYNSDASGLFTAIDDFRVTGT
jgi:hypothetical protein